jgi:hypothetical protein
MSIPPLPPEVAIPLEHARVARALHDRKTNKRDLESFDALARALERAPRDVMAEQIAHLATVLQCWQYDDVNAEEQLLLRLAHHHAQRAAHCLHLLVSGEALPPAGTGQGAPPGESDDKATTRKPDATGTLTQSPAAVDS